MADCDDDVYDEEPGSVEWHDNLHEEYEDSPPSDIPLIDLTSDHSESSHLRDSEEHQKLDIVPLSQNQVIQNPNFRMDAKNFFLTYPQCSLTKEFVCSELRKLLGDKLNGLIVCEEDHHQEEGKHLHALALCNRRINIRNSRYFDIVAHHGDYKVARDVKASVIYIKKDKNFLEWGIVPQYFPQTKAERHKGSISAEIWEDLQRGMKFHDLFIKYGKFCVLHLRQLQVMYNEYTTIVTTPKPWLGLLELSYEGAWKEIATWINTNVGKERPHGQMQLFICGTTGLGKSWMAIQLSNYFKTYWAPNTETYWDGISNETQLVVFDEFNTTHTITFLNQFLDGTPMNVKVKGAQFHKTSNPAMIILANHSLRNIYCKADDIVFDCLSRRLTQVTVTVRCPFEFL